MSDPIADFDYAKWYEIGLRNSWISPFVCYTHDGLPTTSTEDEQWTEGEDPCVFIARSYDSIATRKAVEANCTFAEWRRPNGV